MTVIVIEKKINIIVIDIILCNWTQPWREVGIPATLRYRE